MKYLHIMPPSQRMMLTYIEMLRKDFSVEQHKIVLCEPITQNDGGLLLFENVVPFEHLGKSRFDKLRNIEKELNNADRIVFHSFMPTRIWTLALLLNQRVLEKSIWVIWGIDLYNFKRDGKSLHSFLFNKIGYYLRSKLRYPVVVSLPDIKEYNDRFGMREVLYAPYAIADSRYDLMDSILNNKEHKREYYDKDVLSKEKSNTDLVLKEEDDVPSLKIQVCHNGYAFNNHFEILRYLYPLCSKRDNNIQIFLPISYGDNTLTDNVKYTQALKSYIKQKFIDRVKIIDKMMPNNEYTIHLSEMDIAIFNAPRHNALGNILQLLYMGKKVYLSDRSPLMTYLRNVGFTIHDVKELDGISYEKLSEKDNQKDYRQQIREMFGVETMRRLWTEIFADCEKINKK